MPTDKPNVLLILADDIGWFDVSAYHRGIMGTAGAMLKTTVPQPVNLRVDPFEEFPPSQAPAYFNPQAIVEKVVNAAAQRHGN